MESARKKRFRGTRGTRCKRKRKASKSDEDGPAFLSSKYAEPPASKIYNSRIRTQAPAELFRKDLISAMKLADSEPLTSDDYWLIEDSWKPEWEKGVQVPVNPESLPEPKAIVFRKRKNTNFKLPKKMIRMTKDETFSPVVHSLSFTSALSEQVCRYDLDDMDIHWLDIVNEDRNDFGLEPIEESVVEKVIEDIEDLCFDNLQESLRGDPSFRFECDDDAICDVCRSPDSEDGNEMVFCDACNICVHQSCYGITQIPEGSWICRTCALGIQPSCIFCPNRGGAMKPTSCEQWCHVSCAIWIPEVAIGNVEVMEPVVKVADIPPFRWSLLCFVCNERIGVCIQCTSKGCKVSYHVTCAFKAKLRMRAIMSDLDDDALRLKSFCEKHSEEFVMVSDVDSDETNKREMELNSEEKPTSTQKIMEEKESDFSNFSSLEDVVSVCPYDRDIIETVYNYWKLKRKANFNRPLLLPREVSVATNSAEGSYTYDLVKKMVALRRDLERARNLCYMITKREKMAKSWINIKFDIFKKQMTILSDTTVHISKDERHAVLMANTGDLAYDKKHTGEIGPSPNTLDVLNTLIGEENTKIQLNGILKMRKKNETSQMKKVPNPYAKHYLNGLLKRSQKWLATVDQQKWESADSYGEASPKRERNISCTSTSDHMMSDDGVDVGKVVQRLSSSLPQDTTVQTDLCNKSDTVISSSSLELREGSDFNASASKCTSSTTTNDERLSCNSSAVDKPDATANKMRALVEPIADTSIHERKRSPKKVKRRKFLNSEIKKNLNGHHKHVKKKKLKSKKSAAESEESTKVLPPESNQTLSISCEMDADLMDSELLDVPKGSAEPLDILLEVSNIAQDVILETVVNENLCDAVSSPKCREDSSLLLAGCEVVGGKTLLSTKEELCNMADVQNEYSVCAYEVVLENSDCGDEESQNSAESSDKGVENGEVPLLNVLTCDSEAENPPSVCKVEKLRLFRKGKGQYFSCHSSVSKKNNCHKRFVNKALNSPLSSDEGHSVNKTDSEDPRPKLKESSPKNDEPTQPAKVIPRKGSLTGYKIPKKPRSTVKEESSLEQKRGSSPLSPLTSLSTCSTTTSSSYTTFNSYQTRPNKSFITKNLLPKFNNHKSRQKPPAVVSSREESRVVVKPAHKGRTPESYQWRTMFSGERVEVSDASWRPLHFPAMGPRPFHPHRFPNPNFRQWTQQRDIAARRQLNMPFDVTPNPNT